MVRRRHHGTLYKGKGLRSLISSYRDVTLADFNGESFGAFVRVAIIAATRTLAGDAQHGSGMNGGTTDICHLAVTECFALARTRKTAVGALFIDLVSAFATITRRIAIPDLPESEEAWKRHVVNIGFSAVDAEILCPRP